MKLSKCRVFVELSNHSWIEMMKDYDGNRIVCGGGDQEEDFDANKLSQAMDILEEVVLE